MRIDENLLQKLRQNDPSVEILFLSIQSISEVRQLAEAISNNRTVRVISIQEADFGDQGIQLLADALAGNDKLESLWILNDKITDDGVLTLTARLQTCPALNTFSMNAPKMSNLGAIAVASLVQSMSAIRSLSLHGDQIGADSTETVIEALGRATTLKTLELGSCEINENTARKLKALSQGISVDGLRLFQCSISKAALPIIVQLNVPSLIIESTLNVDTDGIQAIVQALIGNTQLSHLSLTLKIPNDDEAVFAVAKLIKINTALKHLTLNFNGDMSELSEAAVRTLGEALQDNTKLQRLSLDNCMLRDANFEVFAECLQRNNKLKLLDIKTDASIASIRQFLALNYNLVFHPKGLDDDEIHTLKRRNITLTNLGVSPLIDDYEKQGRIDSQKLSKILAALRRAENGESDAEPCKLLACIELVQTNRAEEARQMLERTSFNHPYLRDLADKLKDTMLTSGPQSAFQRFFKVGEENPVDAGNDNNFGGPQVGLGKRKDDDS